MATFDKGKADKLLELYRQKKAAGPQKIQVKNPYSRTSVDYESLARDTSQANGQQQDITVPQKQPLLDRVGSYVAPQEKARTVDFLRELPGAAKQIGLDKPVTGLGWNVLKNTVSKLGEFIDKGGAQAISALSSPIEAYTELNTAGDLEKNRLNPSSELRDFKKVWKTAADIWAGRANEIGHPLEDLFTPDEPGKGMRALVEQPAQEAAQSFYDDTSLGNRVKQIAKLTGLGVESIFGNPFYLFNISGLSKGSFKIPKEQRALTLQGLLNPEKDSALRVLGLEKGATNVEIKLAYRKLAHKYHPDKVGGDEALFKTINDAYASLTKNKQFAIPHKEPVKPTGTPVRTTPGGLQGGASRQILQEGVSQKPVIPSQNTPLAAFQMVNSAQQEAMNTIVQKLEKAKAKKTKLIAEGRDVVATKKSLATINKTIEKIKAKLNTAQDNQDITTGPVSAPKIVSPTIELPAPETVIPLRQPNTDIVVWNDRAKTEIAKPTTRILTVKPGTIIKTPVRNTAQIDNKTTKIPVRKTAPIVIREPKSYSQIAKESSARDVSKKSSAIQRLIAGRKGTKTVARTEPKTATISIPKESKRFVTDVDLFKKLTKMKKDGKTENDFMMLEAKAAEDFAAGKTTTDKSIAINDFIEDNFRKSGGRLYSKTSKTIDTAAKRGVKKVEPKKLTWLEKLRNRSGAKTEVEFKLVTEGQRLIRKYGKLVSESGTPRRAAGVHYKNTGNILVRSLTDIPTVSHELTHRLDSHLGITDKMRRLGDDSILNDLEEIYLAYYPGANKKASNSLKTREGLATLIENYALNPEIVTEEFPLLVGAILKSTGKYYDKKVAELVADVDSIIGRYQALADIDKVGAMSAADKQIIPANKTFTKADDATTFFADYIHPFEKLARVFGKDMTNEDPSVWFRHRRNASNVAMYNISQNKDWYLLNKDGEMVKKFDYNMKSIGKDLIDKGLYTIYGNYLKARRKFYENKELEELQASLTPTEEDIDRIETLKKIQETEEWDMNVVNNVVNQFKDEFKEYDQKVDSINEELLKLLIDVKIVDAEAGARMLKTKGYIPFFRTMLDEIEKTPVMKSGKSMPSTVIQNIIKRKGSKKAIEDPFISSIKASMHVFEKAMLQKTFENIYKMRSRGDVIKEVETQPVPMGNKIVYPKNKGNVISFKHNDKVVTLGLSPELAQVFQTDLELRSQGNMARMVKWFSRLFVKSTTGVLYPAFMLTNILIDSPSAYAQSQNTVKPIIDGVRYIAKAKTNKNSFEAQTWKEWRVFGGLESAQIAMYDKSSTELMRKIGIKQLARGKVKEAFVSLKDIFSVPSEYSEALNRYPEYHRARLAGKSQPVAMEESARITASFSHTGSLGNPFMRSLLQSVPYGNSPLQVTASAIRGIRDPKTRVRAVRTYMVLASLSVGGLMKLIYSFKKAKDSGDEDEIERIQTLINNYKNFNTYELGNNIITIDSFTKEGILKMRTPANYNIIGTLINMSLAEQYLGKEFDYKDYIDAIKDPFISAQFDITEPLKLATSWLAPPMKAIIESGLGKKTFPEVKDLEPFYMATWNSEDRYFPYTNDIAIMLGQTEVMKAKGISPLQIEHFLKTVHGRGIENLYKNINDGLPDVLKNQFDEIQRVFKSKTYDFHGVGYEQFYEDRNRMNNDYSKARKAKDRNKVRELADTNKIYNKVSEMMTSLRKINAESDNTIPNEYSNDIYGIIEALNKKDYVEAEKLYRSNARGINYYIEQEKRRLR